MFLLEFEKHGDFGITSMSVNQQATHIIISDIEHVCIYKISIGTDEVKLDRLKQSESTPDLKNVIHTKFFDDGKQILTFDNSGTAHIIQINDEEFEITKSYSGKNLRSLIFKNSC